MTREPVSIRKHRETVKKRNHHNPYAEANKIRKHHPYEERLNLRKKTDETDLRKKTETNAFADFLSRVTPNRQVSRVPPPPPPTPPSPPPTLQKMRRGTQTAVKSASVTTSPAPPIPQEFKHEPPKQERVQDDDANEDDYDEDDNFVEDEVREYGRLNVGPVASPYLMHYVHKGRFLDTQYGVRKDGDMFMIGDSPIVGDTGGDITIKDRMFKGFKGL